MNYSKKNRFHSVTNRGIVPILYIEWKPSLKKHVMYNVKERERNLYSFVISYVYPVSHETRFMEFFIIFIFCVVRTGTRGGGSWVRNQMDFLYIPFENRPLNPSEINWIWHFFGSTIHFLSQTFFVVCGELVVKKSQNYMLHFPACQLAKKIRT